MNRSFVLMLTVALAFTLQFLGGCAGENREGAERALRALSLTDVVIEPATHPWNVFNSRCSKDDGIQHVFTAKNQSGDAVTGVVCCGAWGTNKGCTVRF